MTVRQELHELGKVGLERPAHQLASPVEDIVKGLGLEREAPNSARTRCCSSNFS